MDGLYAIKPWFVRRLRGLEDILVSLRVSADALTWGAVAAAALAGIAVAAGTNAPLLWLAVAPLALTRIALNALDGSVARRTGTARPSGALLNEACDRIADALFLAPLALIVHPGLAFGALAATLLASFAGVLSQALTGVRDYGGPMGKADRMLIVGVASLVAPAAPRAWTFAAATLALGALLTAATRMSRIHGRLRHV